MSEQRRTPGAGSAARILDGMLAERESEARVPRVVLAGEANSGKTTLANFLLQAQLLIADIIPNTPCPTLLRFGETAHLRVHRGDGPPALRSLADLHRAGRERAQLIEVYLPSAVLRRLEILDLPGLSSRADAEAQSQWIKAADICIWCTVATQAWKASEQAMWLSLAAPKEASFLVMTHRDLLSPNQLSDVAERLTRETQRFFAQWTAVATPEAIGARNPRGEVVKQDVWTSTGVEEFMRNLLQLLRGVAPQRSQAAPLPERLALAPPVSLPHPLPPFGQLRQRVTRVLNQDMTPQQAAAIMVGELDSYARDILRPWLVAHIGAPPDMRRIDGLVPKGGAEIMACLTGGDSHPTSFTPARILQQIEAELIEALPPEQHRQAR